MTQLELFPTSLRLTRIDPARNMRRFYRLALQPDLFGGCTLIREWGRIGQGGKLRLEAFANEGRAVDALIALQRQKVKRGYDVSGPTDQTIVKWTADALRGIADKLERDKYEDGHYTATDRSGRPVGTVYFDFYATDP